jgi:hypothetical protein
MNKFMVKRGAPAFTLLSLFACALLQLPVSATKFGQGDFGDSTFGSLSSLSMSFSGDVAMTLALNGGAYEGSGSHNITVTTNNAPGYRLYLHSPTSSNMTIAGGGDTIAASANSSPGALASNTWGFNTSGSSTNFQGVLTTPTQIKITSEPYTSGDITSVTYGTKASATKSAGNYTANVVYTAVPRFE